MVPYHEVFPHQEEEGHIHQMTEVHPMEVPPVVPYGAVLYYQEEEGRTHHRLMEVHPMEVGTLRPAEWGPDHIPPLVPKLPAR